MVQADDPHIYVIASRFVGEERWIFNLDATARAMTTLQLEDDPKVHYHRTALLVQKEIESKRGPNSCPLLFDAFTVDEMQKMRSK